MWAAARRSNPLPPPPRAWVSGMGFARLKVNDAVDFAVDFGADEEDEGVDVEEEEDHDDAADGAVGLIEAGVAIDVELEDEIEQKPDDDGEDRAGAERPISRALAGAEIVHDAQDREEQEQRHGIAAILTSQMAGSERKPRATTQWETASPMGRRIMTMRLKMATNGDGDSHGRQPPPGAGFLIW